MRFILSVNARTSRACALTSWRASAGSTHFARLCRDVRPARYQNGLTVDVIGLSDLVVSKKTQRDKDWPMIRRLMEVSYLGGTSRPAPTEARFWLRELRTPVLLVEAVHRFRTAAREIVAERPLLDAATARDKVRLEEALTAEEAMERELDRAYWAPLRAELEQLRRSARRGGDVT